MQATSALRLQTAQPRLPAARNALNRLLQPKPFFALHDHCSPRRREVETYIAEKFDSAYGAKITEFLPELFAMLCRTAPAKLHLRPV
jgi:hypothetical protein